MKNYWIDVIDGFLLEKSINEWVCLNTIKTYQSVFNTLLNYEYIDFYELSSFNNKNIMRFLWEALIKNKWSSHTYNRYRKNIKVFCDYLIFNWLLNENPIDWIKERKVWKNLPKFLSTKQIKELERSINMAYPCENFMSIRNNTIMYFYLLSGLRLQELVNLKLEDINFTDRLIKINNWKWNKDRIIPLIDILYSKLLPYKVARKYNNDIRSNILFPTRFWNCLQHRDIYVIFDKVKSRLDFRLTPHMLRHTFATELVRKNVNIYNVSRILGHSNLKTTQIYLWLDMWELNINLNKAKLFS